MRAHNVVTEFSNPTAFKIDSQLSRAQDGIPCRQHFFETIFHEYDIQKARQFAEKKICR